MIHSCTVLNTFLKNDGIAPSSMLTTLTAQPKTEYYTNYHELMQDYFAWQERRGFHVYRHALENGVLLRPLGNVVYFMPPYVITEEQIQQLADVAWQGIERATADI